MTLRRPALAALALLTLPVGPLHAGGLRVMPVRIDVPQDKRHCALTISNDTARPVSIQVRGFGWSMDASGSETLDPDTGPVINPAIFTLAQGKSQLVRCSLPAPRGRNEGSWRLILDELPSEEAAQPGTIRSVLRISIPVFRTPAKARPQLDWQKGGTEADGSRIILRNTGTRHVRIAALDPRIDGGANGHSVLPAFGYLLAGSAWTLRVAAPLLSDGDTLRITTEDGASEVAAPARPGSPAS